MTPPGMNLLQMAREGWFWSEILRDHLTFIHDALPPQELKVAEVADRLKAEFDTLHDEAQEAARRLGADGPAGSWVLLDRPVQAPLERFQGVELREADQGQSSLQRRMVEAIQSVHEFKEEVLQAKLDCRLTLNMGPSLLQHMLNETEEAYRVMTGLRDRAKLPLSMEALHHHLLWLPDAAGHAAVLHSGLDGIETELLKETDRFKHLFTGMELRAIELYAMLRVAPRMIGVLKRLNKESLEKIATFRSFLEELREHLEGCEILGTLAPPLADHMLREELYYTEKIAMLGES